MKNYKIYLVGFIALLLGLLLGKLFFTSSLPSTSSDTSQVKETDEKEIWTCSMHPQIRKTEPGDCPICGMDLIPANQEESNVEIGFQMTEEAIKLADIQTTTIGEFSNSESSVLRLNGTLKENETQSSSLVSHIPGRIENLFVSFTGEQVRKGQKIATLYSPELITAQKELLEAKKIQDISPELLTAAKNKLRYWKIDDHVVQDILDNEKIRENFDIYSEHTGIVKRKRVSVGDYLGTGEVLFDLQNLDVLWALFDVYESDLPKVKVGRTIEFTTPSTQDKIHRATINFVDPIINPNTRTAAIRGEVSNTSGRLKPEMFITGKLTNYQKNSKLLVPQSSVLWTGTRSVVYVKVPNTTVPTFEYKEIEIGQSTQNGYTIVSGLEVGEEVVTNGAFVIDASAQLNNQVSMMNKYVQTKSELRSDQLPDYKDSTPTDFKKQITAVVNTYFSVKDALVEDRAKDASKAASQVLNQVESVDMSLLEGKAHMYWMEQLNAIQSHGQEIEKTDDIEKQREQFIYFSKSLINSVKVFGVEDDTFFVQHCPMANEDNGADWLSKQEKILNPYFGDKMLKCGMVQDTIQ